MRSTQKRQCFSWTFRLLLDLVSPSPAMSKMCIDLNGKCFKARFLSNCVDTNCRVIKYFRAPLFNSLDEVAHYILPGNTSHVTVLLPAFFKLLIFPLPPFFRALSKRLGNPRVWFLLIVNKLILTEWLKKCK